MTDDEITKLATQVMHDHEIDTQGTKEKNKEALIALLSHLHHYTGLSDDEMGVMSGIIIRLLPRGDNYHPNYMECCDGMELLLLEALRIYFEDYEWMTPEGIILARSALQKICIENMS